MSDHKDYSSVLNKARRRRRRRGGWDTRLLLMIAGAVLAVLLLILAGVGISRAVSGKAGDGGAAQVATPSDASPAQEAQLSPEEQAAMELEAETQRVIDSYENLGIVQVSGYVNIRREPSLDGDIIGKLSGDGACEVLELAADPETFAGLAANLVDAIEAQQYFLRLPGDGPLFAGRGRRAGFGMIRSLAAGTAPPVGKSPYLGLTLD